MSRHNKWKKKVEASIACNNVHIRTVRNALRDQKHRGFGRVWYWTWDIGNVPCPVPDTSHIAINKIVYTSASLSVAHQPRLTRTYFNNDGTGCKKSRIPEFYAVECTRQTDGTLLVDNAIWRLVAMAEIKPAPIDDSRIAGDWWTFEVFDKAGYPFGDKAGSDSASYVPSSDQGTDVSSIPSSDRDELDIIGVDSPSSDGDELDVISLDDEEDLSQHRHRQPEVDLTFYRLLDNSSDRAFVKLVKTVVGLVCNKGSCETSVLS